MKKNIIFLIAVVLVVGGVFAFMRTQYREQKQDTVNTKASEHLLREDHPSIGDKSAKVTLVEFLDPECEACAAIDPTIKGLVKEFEGKVYYVVRYMPLHKNSLLAAAALEETRASGKYFQALSMLFYAQPEWASHQNPKPELIAVILKKLDVDIMNIKPNDLIEKHRTRIELDAADGKALGVRGTPTLFINGQIVDDMSYQALKTRIQSLL
ncbi:MAG: thioredoxin domain-containing protein [Bdellovibrionota bacterium]